MDNNYLISLKESLIKSAHLSSVYEKQNLNDEELTIKYRELIYSNLNMITQTQNLYNNLCNLLLDHELIKNIKLDPNTKEEYYWSFWFLKQNQLKENEQKQQTDEKLNQQLETQLNLSIPKETLKIFRYWIENHPFGNTFSKQHLYSGHTWNNLYYDYGLEIEPSSELYEIKYNNSIHKIQQSYCDLLSYLQSKDKTNPTNSIELIYEKTTTFFSNLFDFLFKFINRMGDINKDNSSEEYQIGSYVHMILDKYRSFGSNMFDNKLCNSLYDP